ncbi:hypothetical protein J6590_041558 [Homalodisca vitripennis]|nr:hypothetical protein J6590_041558 [Homalodisca vitripennis]
MGVACTGTSPEGDTSPTITRSCRAEGTEAPKTNKRAPFCLHLARAGPGLAAGLPRSAALSCRQAAALCGVAVIRPLAGQRAGRPVYTTPHRPSVVWTPYSVRPHGPLACARMLSNRLRGRDLNLRYLFLLRPKVQRLSDHSAIGTPQASKLLGRKTLHHMSRIRAEDAW